MSVVITHRDPDVFKHRQHFRKKSRRYGTQSSSSDLRQNVRSYIALYPVLTIAQSALHFTFLTDLFNQTPSQLLGKGCSHMLQLMLIATRPVEFILVSKDPIIVVTYIKINCLLYTSRITRNK